MKDLMKRAKSLVEGIEVDLDKPLEVFTIRQYGEWTIEYVRRTDCPCICCSKPLIHKATLTKDL